MDFKSLDLKKSFDQIFNHFSQMPGVGEQYWISSELLAKLSRISEKSWGTVESLRALFLSSNPNVEQSLCHWIWSMALRTRAQVTYRFEGDNKNYSFLPVSAVEGDGIVGIFVLQNSGVDLLGIHRDLARFSRHIGFCVTYQRAQDLSYVDDLTSLYNQRYLPKVLEREIERSHRQKKKFCLLFMDVDYFKRINDGHGHLVGSRLLTETADLLRSTIRSYDPLFRYGGDEFLALLVDTDATTGQKVAERIRKAVENHEFIVDGHKLKLTLSIGLAVFPDHANSAGQLIQLADQAMYYGKNKSRNIVFIAS